MSFKGIIKIDSIEYRILRWNLHIVQRTDQTGRPNTNPSGGLISVTIETDGQTDLIDWAVSPNMTKNGSVFFEGNEISSKKHQPFEFTDGYCVDYREVFCADDSSSMETSIVISAKSLKTGLTELIKNWDKI